MKQRWGTPTRWRTVALKAQDEIIPHYEAVAVLTHGAYASFNRLVASRDASGATKASFDQRIPEDAHPLATRAASYRRDGGHGREPTGSKAGDRCQVMFETLKDSAKLWNVARIRSPGGGKLQMKQGTRASPDPAKFSR